jgi:hypothetical protein
VPTLYCFYWCGSYLYELNRHKQTQTHAYTHTYTYIHTHTCIHIYTHIHILRRQENPTECKPDIILFPSWEKYSYIHGRAPACNKNARRPYMGQFQASRVILEDFHRALCGFNHRPPYAGSITGPPYAGPFLGPLMWVLSWVPLCRSFHGPP